MMLAMSHKALISLEGVKIFFTMKSKKEGWRDISMNEYKLMKIVTISLNYISEMFSLDSTSF